MCAFGDYGVWMESVSEHCHGFTCTVFTAVICLYSNLYTYKASECKHVIIRLHRATLSFHCGTWDMYPVAVP